MTEHEDVENGASAIDNVAPRAVLRACAFHYDVLATEYVADELRIDAIVGLGEVGPVDVGRTGNYDVGGILIGKGGAEGLRSSFGRGVTASGEGGVDVAAVGLGDCLGGALATGLAGRDLEETPHLMRRAIVE